MATLLVCATLVLWLLLLPVRDSHAGCEPRYYPSSQESVMPLVNEEEAVLQGRCHAACAEGETIDGSTVWPSVNSSDCDILRRLAECRRGCIIKAMNPALSTGDCRDECFGSCMTVCNGSEICTYDGSTCTVRCRRPQCTRGCRAYDSLIQLPQVVPPTPVDPPILMRTEVGEREFDAGVLDISYLATDREGSINYTNVTAFVIKVESLRDNSTYYILQPSFSVPLDLGYFACEDVAVSFAAVNAYTASDYSPVTEICVPGEMRFPSQLRQGSIAIESIREDRRPEFFGHAVINVTWERPENFQYLSHYLLIVFSMNGGNCGGVRVRYHYIVEREAVSYVLMTNSSNTPPGFINSQSSRDGCQYRIIIQSQPATEDSPLPEKLIKDIREVTEPPAPGLDFRCHQDIDDRTGLITIIAGWMFLPSPQLEDVLEGIDGYEVKLYLVSEQGATNPPQDRLLQLQRINKNENIYITREFPANISLGHSGFALQFLVIKRNDLFWRAVPGRQVCFFNAAPQPPLPISAESIVITHFEFSGTRLNLNVSWGQPEGTFGGIIDYEISVAEEPQPQRQQFLDGRNNDSVLTAQPFTMIVSGENTEAVIETDIFVTKGARELFLQIRSRSLFRVWSNLSDPVVLILPNSKDGLPVFAYVVIAGVCVFIVPLILFIILMVVVCRKCYEAGQIRKHDFSGVPDSMYNGPFNKNPSMWPPIKLPSKLKTDEWEIPFGNVIVEEELGEGCFGMVYKGAVKGPIPNSKTMATSICKIVAVKFLKSNASGGERKDFLNEMDMMKRIAEGKHTHVVSLVGCITIKEPLCLITEYLMYGNLLSYLETIRELITRRNKKKQWLQKIEIVDAPQPYLDLNSKEEQPPEKESMIPAVITPEFDSPYADLGDIEPLNLLSFAYQIASGMEYLSSLNVVHRDLACRNILVGAGKELKISDFGLSRSVEGVDVYVKLNQGRLPWKWMAIESIMNREFTTASDAWAYGVTLWEIATLGGFPYPSVPNTELLEHLRGGHRLERPENCSTEIYEIMLDCWQENPASRPTFTQLKAKLDAMLLESKEYIQFNNIDTEQPYYIRLNREEGESDTTAEIDHQASNSASIAELDQNVPSGYDHLDDGSEIPEQPLPHPFSMANPYVKTPTKLPYELRFDIDQAKASSEHQQQLQAAVEQASQAAKYGISEGKESD